MGKIIQMVPTGPGTSIFITGFDVETDEISLRSSHAPERVQKEKVVIDNGMAYTNTYHLPIEYIDKFIQENQNLSV